MESSSFDVPLNATDRRKFALKVMLTYFNVQRLFYHALCLSFPYTEPDLLIKKNINRISYSSYFIPNPVSKCLPLLPLTHRFTLSYHGVLYMFFEILSVHLMDNFKMRK